MNSKYGCTCEICGDEIVRNDLMLIQTEENGGQGLFYHGVCFFIANAACDYFSPIFGIAAEPNCYTWELAE